MSGHPTHNRHYDQARAAAQQSLLKGLNTPVTENPKEIVEKKSFVRSLYSYTAGSAENMSISEGEILVLVEEGPEWVLCIRGEEFGWVPGNYVEQISSEQVPREYRYEEDIEAELSLLKQQQEKIQQNQAETKEKIQQLERTRFSLYSGHLDADLGIDYYGAMGLQELSFDIHFLIELLSIEPQVIRDAEAADKKVLESLDVLLTKVNGMSNPSFKKNKTKIESICKEHKASLQKKKTSSAISQPIDYLNLAQELNELAVSLDQLPK